MGRSSSLKHLNLQSYLKEKTTGTKKNGLLPTSCFFLILFVREMRAAKELESKQK